MNYSDEITFKLKPINGFWRWTITFYIDGITFHNSGIGITRGSAFDKAKKWMDETTQNYLEAAQTVQ